MVFNTSGDDAIVNMTNVVTGQILHGIMLHGQLLYGQMSLGNLSTVKDGSTNLKLPLLYFSWVGGS